MIAAVLSRVLDAGEQRRLTSTWADPQVSITDLKIRFRLSPEDIEKLKLELGARPKTEPLSPWWRAERIRRHRRGWA